jgi:hypothetical protein
VLWVVCSSSSSSGSMVAGEYRWVADAHLA